MFCKARKIPLPLQDRVKEKLETMVRQGILEPVQPGGVTNASPVVWQRKKNGALRLCVDLKVHINGKVMDEDYPIPDMETIFHNLHGASYFGKIDLSDAYYQIELDEDAKEICTINTSPHRKDCSRCAGFLRPYRTLHQSSRIALSQLSKESRVWSYSKTTFWYMEQQKINTRNKCLQSRVGYVKKISP